MSPGRTLALVVYLFASAGILVWVAGGPFERQGDGWEYYGMLEAFDRHRSFDIRPGDEDALVARIAPRMEPSTWGETEGDYRIQMKIGVATAPNGTRHALHFWLYPLSAYPAKLALRVGGGYEPNALKVANAALFLLGVGAVLFGAAGGPGRRLLFALLVGVSPAYWYVGYTGAEVFSWAFATFAVVALDTRRYAVAALFAAIAATQNPPLVLLAGVCVPAALWERRWRAAGLAVLACGVAAAPVAYCEYHFGVPSLITKQYTDTKLIGVSRTACLLFDLNVGLLPYVPVLLLAAPVGLAAAVARRDVLAVLVALAFAGMLLGVQVQTNWNSDGRGLQRYLLWMLPLLAWVVMRGWGGGWRAAAVAVHALTTGAVLVCDPPTPTNYLEHRAVARWVMTEFPTLYNPDTEIFVERMVQYEWLPLEKPADATPTTEVVLPLAFGRSNGEVTKLLVHRESAARLTARFKITPEYLPELLRAAGASETPVYVHPPRRAVWAEPGTVHGAFDHRQDLRP